MRTFVAIPLPAVVRNALAITAGGIDGARWVDPEQIHLTLAFLGEVPAGRGEGRLDTVSDLVGAIASGRTSPLELRLAAAEGGAIAGRTRSPRVLWVRLAPSSALTALREQLVKALRTQGLHPTNERFVPHVTVARLRDANPADVTRWIHAHAIWELPAFTAEGIGVYTSVLRPEGARHQLHSWHSLPVWPRPRSKAHPMDPLGVRVEESVALRVDDRRDGATIPTRLQARLRRGVRATK